MKLKWLVPLLVMFASSPGLSAPTISGYSGSVVEGDYITISGSNFGTGATILCYDNFDSYANGTTISYAGGPAFPLMFGTWDDDQINGNNYVDVDNTQSISGSNSARFRNIMASEGTGGSQVRVEFFSSPLANEFYTRYWRREHAIYNGELWDGRDSGGTAQINYKQWYTWSSSAIQPYCVAACGQNVRLQWVYGGMINPDSAWRWGTQGCCRNSGDPVYYVFHTGPTWPQAIHTWVYYEWYVKTETTPTSNDGIGAQWINCVAKNYVTGINDCTDNSPSGYNYIAQWNYGNQIGGGAYDPHWPYSNLDEFWSNTDDFYCATSRARVELGNASTWSACTRRDICPHTSWGATITVLVQTPHFVTDDDAWIYVIDSDGNPNASGYHVIIGDEIGNNSPVAVDDFATVDNESSVDIFVLANDTDADSDPLTIVAVTQGTYGTVSHDGTVATYTHDGSDTFSDTFTYTVSDGQGGSDIGTVTMTINPADLLSKPGKPYIYLAE